MIGEPISKQSLSPAIVLNKLLIGAPSLPDEIIKLRALYSTSHEVLGHNDEGEDEEESCDCTSVESVNKTVHSVLFRNSWKYMFSNTFDEVKVVHCVTSLMSLSVEGWRMFVMN